MVTLDNGNYRIAVQELASGTVAHAFARATRRIAEFRAQRGDTHLLRARGQPRRARHRLVDGLTGLRLKA